ncbi:MAG: aldehyde dehydrogenase family protein [Anaerolineales bacterium]|nr:aldehyde dehydrogenase family protein [Anaerolineales bacterium]MDW8161295.1 aldehyde dehydrogenase family protein [Anaerolineales bacterium]
MIQSEFPSALFIGGKWLPSRGGELFATLNPATEEILAEVPRANAEDVELAVQAAYKAFYGEWSETTPAERGRLLYRLAQAVQAHREELAKIETLDNGKPFKEALADIDGVIQTIEYNAGAADKLQGDTIPLGKEVVDFTWLEPLGVTAHIVPWNFPLGIAVRSVAPALAAGCTVVLKPAEETPLSALRLASLAKEVGFPDGVLNVITGYGEEAGAALVRHPLVRGVTFTGSVETGRKVMALVAEAPKPLVLELGGKNALIVFEDADLERAVGDAIEAVFGNCGQVCSAASRLLLQRSIQDEFMLRFRERASQLRVAPGLEDGDLGPLVSEEQWRRAMGYIQSGVAEGARLTLGGQRPAHLTRGYFLMPTIFEDVQPSMRIAQEEIFAPVVVTTLFEDEEQAIQLANGVSYGLVAGVYTQDIRRALTLAQRLETGSVWINGWYLGGVQAPTGGVKASGFGRERGLPGLHNYLQIKNIAIRL